MTPARPNPTKLMPAKPMPARPRDAASLIVYDADRRLVLMGQRAKKSRFLPDMFVFPGGGVEPADKQLARAFPVKPLKTLPRHTDLQTAHALALSAVRETAEETGLFLANKAGTHQAPAAEGWDLFRDRALFPVLAPLAYMGRAITPTDSPLRSHARFFAVERHQMQGRLTDTDELRNADWYPLAHARHKLPLIDVTEMMLDRLALMLDKARPPRPIFMHYRNGKTRIDHE